MARARTGSSSVARSAWGDYDNDGWLDLFVARIGKYDSSFNVVQGQTNWLYHNNGDGTFTKITSGPVVNETAVSFGCAWGDYDNDGFLDLFVSNGWVAKSANNFLYHNSGNSNHWLNLKLVGAVSNRAAIGAKVRVKATIGQKTVWQLREISGGSGHGCQNDLRAQFGLGDATNADVIRIEWPSGIGQTLTNVPAGQFLTVIEHQELPESLTRISTSLTWTPQTGAQLSTAGPKGARYLFETSSNLVDWTRLGSTTNLNGVARFLDPRPVTITSRFYRISLP